MFWKSCVTPPMLSEFESKKAPFPLEFQDVVWVQIFSGIPLRDQNHNWKSIHLSLILIAYLSILEFYKKFGQFYFASWYDTAIDYILICFVFQNTWPSPAHYTSRTTVGTPQFTLSESPSHTFGKRREFCISKKGKCTFWAITCTCAHWS